MAGKKYTVMLIPNNASGARPFGISRRTIGIAVLLLLSLIGTSVYLAYDRVSLEKRILRLEPLQERNRAQRALLERFGERLRGMDKNLVRLRKLEEQLRIMASLKPRQRGNTLGVGGVAKNELLEGLGKLGAGERKFAGRLNRQFLDLELRTADQERAFKDVLQTFRQKRVLLAHTPSVIPVKGWVTSGFGYRTSAYTGRREFHSGVDIVARRGAPVSAPADGVVIKAGREGGYGNIVELRHMQGIVTRFAHNQKNLVRVGQRVRRGDLLAQVGSTGRSTGPHLHYEVRLNGVAVNPRVYILDEVARR